jgi:hypothetical protein
MPGTYRQVNVFMSVALSGGLVTVLRAEQSRCGLVIEADFRADCLAVAV